MPDNCRQWQGLPPSTSSQVPVTTAPISTMDDDLAEHLAGLHGMPGGRRRVPRDGRSALPAPPLTNAAPSPNLISGDLPARIAARSTRPTASMGTAAGGSPRSSRSCRLIVHRVVVALREADRTAPPANDVALSADELHSEATLHARGIGARRSASQSAAHSRPALQRLARTCRRQRASAQERSSACATRSSSSSLLAQCPRRRRLRSESAHPTATSSYAPRLD